MNAALSMFGKTYKVTLVEEKYYDNGSTAVQAYDEEGPFCTLSVNLPESSALPKGAFYAKSWSENRGFVEQLLEQGVIEPVNAPIVSSGFIDEIRAYRLKK